MKGLCANDFNHLLRTIDLVFFYFLFMIFSKILFLSDIYK